MPIFTPPPTNPPVLVRRDFITLEYPFTSPTLTLDLRNPEFGNQERVNFSRISRKSRAGTPIIFFNEIWPTEDLLFWTFIDISEAKKDLYKTFIAASLGKEIKLTDFETHIWKGIIQNPSNEIVCDKKADACNNGRYTIVFEFLGELQSWP